MIKRYTVTATFLNLFRPKLNKKKIGKDGSVERLESENPMASLHLPMVEIRRLLESSSVRFQYCVSQFSFGSLKNRGFSSISVLSVDLFSAFSLPLTHSNDD